jgi:uncharacterized protein DUF6438
MQHCFAGTQSIAIGADHGRSALTKTFVEKDEPAVSYHIRLCSGRRLTWTGELYKERMREVGARVELATFDHVSLERTPCYGSRPAYRVMVSGTGQVSYEGFSHVDRVGLATKQLDDEAIAQLIAALNEARVFSLRESYRSQLDGCPSVWTDNPSVIMEVSAAGRVKAINHYLGCRAYSPNNPELDVPYPEALTLLEKHVDEIIGTREWTGWPRDEGSK